MRRCKLKQRVLSIIMSVILLVGMVPDLGLAALAADGEDSVVSDDTAVSEDDAVSEDAAAAEETADDEEAVSEDVEETAGSGEEEAEEEDIVDANTYNIWIGGVQVTDENKDNIPGVTAGKVSYNPSTKTLKFEGASGFKREGKKAGDAFAMVRCAQEVKITGDLQMELEDNKEIAITLGGSGTTDINADITISGTGKYGIFSNNEVNYKGGDINIDLSGDNSVGIHSVGKAVFSYASVNVKAVVKGIEFEDDLSITGGVIDAVSAFVPKDDADYEVHSESKSVKYCGIGTSECVIGTEQKIEITGGTVYAEGDQWGIFSSDYITINGGKVTTKARGKSSSAGTGQPQGDGKDGKFNGLYAQRGDIQIISGYVKSWGPWAAIASRKGQIQIGSGMKLASGDTITSGNNGYSQFIRGQIDGMANKDFELYSTEVAPNSGVNSYGLRLGKTEVTEMNKDNIHLEKGYAKYDPTTKTLTFVDAEIDTPFSEADWFYYVVANNKIDKLTIKGDLKIPEVKADGYGIRAKALDIDANIEIKNINNYGYGINAWNGNITISGGKIDISPVSNSITDQVALCSEEGNITISGGKLVLSGTKQAIESKKLTIDGMTVTIPSAYTVKNGTVYEGANPAKRVVMEYDTPYKLWVGNTQIKESNCEAIPGISLGSASFDTKTNTLTLKNVNKIDTAYTDASKTMYIYSELEDGLVISGSADLSGTDYGIFANAGDVTLSGTFKFNVADDAVRNDKGSVTVTSGSKLELKTTAGFGIYTAKDISISSAEAKMDTAAAGISAIGGDVKLNKATVSVNATGSAATGIVAGNELNIAGGSVWASGNKKAVSAAKIVLGEETGVISPAGAAVSADGTTINGKDGKPVTAVMFGKVEEVKYDVWVGGVQVTSQNAGNVLGDGKVSYDVASNTLTFKDAVVNKYSKDSGNSIIYTTKDLTIKGKASLVNADAEGGIAITNQEAKLKIEADLDIQTKLGGIVAFAKEVDITSGNIGIKVSDAESYGIMSSGSLVIENGNVAVNAKMAGIYCKKLEVKGGKVEVSADKAAVATSDDNAIMIDSKLEIAEPAGGKAAKATLEGSDVFAIVDAEGNVAKSVKIDYKKDVVKYTVTFNLMGHGNAIASQSVAAGSKAVKPADPEADGFLFGGWYTEKELANAYDFNAAVTKNIELFAKWTEVVNPGPAIRDSALDPVEVITDTTSKLYLVKGQKFNVAAGWAPVDKQSKKIISISKKGRLSAKKDGTATIKNGEQVIEVTVCKPVITKSLKLEAGQTENNKITISGADGLDVLFYSAKPDVALVDESGAVTAVAKGKATISAFINGKEYKCTVSVKESETAKTRTMHAVVGASKPISVKGVKKWESSDPEVAEMNKKGSKVTAKKAGVAKLTASANDVDYTIDFYAEDITVSGEKVTPGKTNKYSIALNAGESTTISLPGVEQDVIFKSSKPDSAFIDEDGNVYARSAGKSKFTAKLNGKTITISVTVNN